ncbi:hypothetical protein PO909_030738 [Leuciscus waleckii]
MTCEWFSAKSKFSSNMYFLKFILLLLIPSYISGGCQTNISVSGGQKVCSSQNFTLTCRFDCHGPQNHVKVVKDQEFEHSLESSCNSITLSIHVHSANNNHTGTYSCQTKSLDSMSMAYVKVEDCDFPAKLSTVNKTSSSLATTYQSSTPSRILDPVLIWYILFKTAVFLIGTITAVLKTVCQKH